CGEAGAASPLDGVEGGLHRGWVDDRAGGPAVAGQGPQLCRLRRCPGRRRAPDAVRGGRLEAEATVVRWRALEHDERLAVGVDGGDGGLDERTPDCRAVRTGASPRLVSVDEQDGLSRVRADAEARGIPIEIRARPAARSLEEAAEIRGISRSEERRVGKEE